MSTKADPHLLGWLIRDAITRLRVFGSEIAHAIDRPGQAEITIGSAPDSMIVLEHESVSRRHAVIRREGEEYILTDLGSTNGTRENGTDRSSFSLAAGVQVQVGQVPLVVESAKSIELRELLQRLIGWTPGRASLVDEALGSVREMAHLRTVLLLHGEGSMRCVAERLHRLTLGQHRPFCTRQADETGVEALARARGGTLFLDGEALPNDIGQVVLSHRLAERCTRLVVGASSADAAKELATFARSLASIRLPMFAERTEDLDQIIEGYAADGAAEHGFESTKLRPFDLKHIRTAGTIMTHDRADEFMERLVVARNLGVTAGAELLGITHGALSRYLRRAGVPT